MVEACGVMEFVEFMEFAIVWLVEAHGVCGVGGVLEFRRICII